MNGYDPLVPFDPGADRISYSPVFHRDINCTLIGAGQSDWGRVRPLGLDLSNLLNQQDDATPYFHIADLGERLRQSDAVPRRDKLVNKDCLT